MQAATELEKARLLDSEEYKETVRRKGQEQAAWNWQTQEKEEEEREREGRAEQIRLFNAQYAERYL